VEVFAGLKVNLIMNYQFKIESIFKLNLRDKICVFAKLSGTTDFQLSDNATLGNVPIENWFDIPRSHDESGSIRTDLFAFALKENSDSDKLEIGQVVELIP
jgi:hypothetical protein